MIKNSIIVRVGSRETCNPPPQDTDEDHLVLVENVHDAVSGLTALGFEFDSQRYKGMGPLGFVSLRFGEVNYIVTQDKEFFDAFLSASYLAKKFNLTNKADRIDLFDAVMMRKSFAGDYLPSWKYAPKRIQNVGMESGIAEESSPDLVINI